MLFAQHNKHKAFKQYDSYRAGDGMESETLKLEVTLETTSCEQILEKSNKKTSSDDHLLSLQKALIAIAAAQEEQQKILAATKEEKKTIEKTAEIKKEKNDITDVVDSEEHKEKLKDKFKDGVLQITIDMDGFEKKHLEQYQQQLANYARFLAEYLEGGRLVLGKIQQSYTYTDDKKEEDRPKTEVQMITYAETQDYARSNAMNAMLGKAGANHIDPQIKEMWDLWRIFQHNQHMSFYYTSQWRGYGV